MHSFIQIVRPKPGLGFIRRSDAHRAILILAVFGAASMGLSDLATESGLVVQTPALTAGIEDWHGNVARSGR